MTFDEYQEAAMRTASTIQDMDLLLLNGVMGLNGEAGECIDLLKKNMFQGHDLDDEKLMNELGDVLWYAAIIAKSRGHLLSDAASMNITKLKKRYPNGFDAEKSINREV